jgi:uncharacterized membrane protein
MEETRLRSLLKGITWRLTGTVDTMFVSYMVTGKYLIALSVGGIEVISKIILFYFHERIWNKVKLGKKDGISKIK